VGKILGVKELAKYLGVAPITVYRKVRDGEIPAIRIGRKWKFSQELIDEWLREKVREKSPVRKRSVLGSIKGNVSLSEKEEAAILELKDKFLSRYGTKIKNLILFGSKVRGESQKFSDIDLLVVIDSKDWRLYEELKDVAYETMIKYDFGMILSLIVLSCDDFRQLTRTRSTFYRVLEKEGIELWRVA
jgi:excisionase family DNA binding protein